MSSYLPILNEVGVQNSWNGKPMSHVVEATYENGVLRPVRPLPLKDREKVRLTVESLPDTIAGLDAVRRTRGIVPWSGDTETLERMALDPEFDVMESQ